MQYGLHGMLTKKSDKTRPSNAFYPTFFLKENTQSTESNINKIQHIVF